jgi:hypothetical protein
MPLGKNSAQLSLSMWLASPPDIKNEPSLGKSNEPLPQPSVGEKKVTPNQTPSSSPSSGFEISWKGIGVDAIVSIASSIVVMLVIGNKLKTITEYFRDFAQTRESKDLKLFWFGKNSSKNERHALPTYHIVYGSTSDSGVENFTSNEYSKAKELIIKFLESIDCVVEEHMLLANEVLDQTMFDGNVILLTGEAHPILGFDNFVENIKLPYFYRKDGQNPTKLFRRVKKFSGDQIEYRQASVMDSDNTVSLAFATLTRLVDPDTDKIVIILNGGHGFGVSAPAYFLTSYDDRKSSNLRYLDFSKLNKEVHSYQIVLEANNSKKAKKPGLNSRDLHLSTWIRLEVTPNDLNSAITDLCQGSNVSQKKLDTRVPSPASYP